MVPSDRFTTVHRELERKAAAFGNRPFLYFEDSVFGYADVDRQACRVAAGFRRLGFGKGDHVAILAGNRPEFLFLWFGLSKLGLVEVPLNTAHKGEMLAYMLRRSACRALVVEAALVDQVAPVLASLPDLRQVIVLDGGAAATLGERPAMTYDALVDNDGAFDPVEVLWNDPAAIIFTSGTTGPSKGAVLPQNYPLQAAKVIIESLGYDESDRLYTALPLFHGNAQFLSTMPALVSGAAMVLARRFSASSFWPEVRRHGCTAFNAIGGILTILMKADAGPEDADNPLTRIFTAGAPAALHRAFESRFGLKLVEGYGMSEIGMPLMTQDGHGRPGSCGTPHRDYQLRVVDDDGREVPPGVPGELLVRPLVPYAMQLEYYGMPEKTVEAWRDLWFHTGDAVSTDEDGWFYFLDRKKDAIRRRGENISSFEVEAVVNAHPAVRESAAVAVPSDLGEDEVLICVVPKDGLTLAPSELLAHCRPRMADFMVPRFVRILTALPKTPTERVEKYRLRAEGVTADTWDSIPAPLDSERHG